MYVPKDIDPSLQVPATAPHIRTTNRVSPSILNLSGHGFYSGLIVYFGWTRVKSNFVSAQVIACEIPTWEFLMNDAQSRGQEEIPEYYTPRPGQPYHFPIYLQDVSGLIHCTDCAHVVWPSQ